MNTPSPNNAASSQKKEAPQHSKPEDLIGARIAEKRLSKGLTHDGLAKLTKLFDEPDGSKSGISRTTIRGYEVGLYKPGARELRLLCQALEVTPDWLIFGEKELPRALSDSIEQGSNLEQSEIQKFIVALHLLRVLDKQERDVVYQVLHNLAKLKVGETAYRSGVIAHQEIAGLFGDMWSDMRDGKKPTEEEIKELAVKYQPLIEEVAGKNLSDAIASKFSKK